MIKKITLLTFIFLTFFTKTLQNPNGFINVNECVKKGSFVKYLLQEKDSKQFVLALDYGVVVDEGAIVTSEGKILVDTETYKKDQQKLLKNQYDLNENPIYFDGTLAVISSPGQQCFYHWMLQVLPRLKVLKESNLDYDKIYLYSYSYKFRWQVETLNAVLDYLNIDKNRILLVLPNENIVVHAKKLIVPSIYWIPAKFKVKKLDDWYKDFFSSVFIKDFVEKSNKKRIYISRSNASYRRISNEDLLMKFLSSHGFVKVHLEDLSIFEQAQLFNNAEIIIGPHGAGWTNLIFCKPNTKIIEIDHGIKGIVQRSDYGQISGLLRCKYYPFYADWIDDTQSPENILEPINQDITIDMNSFKTFFDAIL